MSKLSKEGFSLVEIAVTIVVLGVIIAGIVPMVSTSFRRVQISSRKATAHRLAQERIEELVGVNLGSDFFVNLTSCTTDPDFWPLGNVDVFGDEAYGELRLNTTDPDDPFMHFRRTTEAAWDLDQDGDLTNEDANNTTGNLSLLRVTVGWDFNNDTVDDDHLSVTTFKVNY